MLRLHGPKGKGDLITNLPEDAQVLIDLGNDRRPLTMTGTGEAVLLEAPNRFMGTDVVFIARVDGYVFVEQTITITEEPMYLELRADAKPKTHDLNGVLFVNERPADTATLGLEEPDHPTTVQIGRGQDGRFTFLDVANISESMRVWVKIPGYERGTYPVRHDPGTSADIKVNVCTAVLPFEERAEDAARMELIRVGLASQVVIIETGRPDVALDKLAKLRSKARNQGLPGLELRAIRLRGDCYRLMLDTDAAIEQYNIVWSTFGNCDLSRPIDLSTATG